MKERVYRKLLMIGFQLGRAVSLLSAEYGIHSSQLYKWRDYTFASFPGLFDDQSEKALAEKEIEREKSGKALYAEIR